MAPRTFGFRPRPQPPATTPHVPDCAVPVTLLKVGSPERRLALQSARAFRCFEPSRSGPFLVTREKLAHYLADDMTKVEALDLSAIYLRVQEAQVEWLKFQQKTAERASPVYPGAMDQAIRRAFVLEGFCKMAATLASRAPEELVKFQKNGTVEEAKALGRLAGGFVRMLTDLGEGDLRSHFEGAESADEFCEAFNFAALDLHGRQRVATSFDPLSKIKVGKALAQMVRASAKHFTTDIGECALALWQCSMTLNAVAPFVIDLRTELNEDRLFPATMTAARTCEMLATFVENLKVFTTAQPRISLDMRFAQVLVLLPRAIDALARELESFASP